MKFLRNIFIIFALMASVTFTAEAQIEKGQKSLGFHGGYATYNTSALAGVSFQYAFSRHFRLAPSVDYIFDHKDVDGLMFCLDYHGPVALNSARTVYFYHLLGLNYASWHHGRPKFDSVEEMAPGEDVSSRDNNFGLDVGAGFEWYVRPTLRLSLEGKFNWIRHANTGLFYLGISYVF
ncbi:MAG: porin family protein [Bacteroides sp.]|nr:porin family protein [Bacteroidales bacterium]MBD5250350.1 porin family protein [Barnesiella sp.]MBD5254258.1 porin family protein [Barnesiella sp.]MBD5369119.1 porin family protein [Bacteroides sp.]